MTVISAFHLRDARPAGQSAGDADRIHRRFGSGVGEAPLWKAESRDEHLGHQRVVLAGADKQRAFDELFSDQAAECGMRVAGEERAVTEREIHVLVPVEVLHTRTRPVAHHQRMRFVELKCRRDAERQDPLRLVPSRVRTPACAGRTEPVRVSKSCGRLH